MIITPEQLRQEAATHKCKLALKAIDVPGYVIDQFKPGRLLDYFVHMCIMHNPPLHWKDAIKWVNENRQQILDQERNNGTRPVATGPSDGEINNGDDAV